MDKAKKNKISNRVSSGALKKPISGVIKSGGKKPLIVPLERVDLFDKLPLEAGCSPKKVGNVNKFPRDIFRTDRFSDSHKDPSHEGESSAEKRPQMSGVIKKVTSAADLIPKTSTNILHQTLCFNDLNPNSAGIFCDHSDSKVLFNSGKMQLGYKITASKSNKHSFPFLGINEEAPLRSSSRLIPLGTECETQKLKDVAGVNPFEPKRIKVQPPRVTVNLEGAFNLNSARKEAQEKNPHTEINKNILRLKPIQRNAFSSHGGTIKVLLPKEFVDSKTRPSNKDEEMNKTSRFRAPPSYLPQRVLNPSSIPSLGLARRFANLGNIAFQASLPHPFQAPHSDIPPIYASKPPEDTTANQDTDNLFNFTFGEFHPKPA